MFVLKIKCLTLTVSKYFWNFLIYILKSERVKSAPIRFCILVLNKGCRANLNSISFYEQRHGMKMNFTQGGHCRLWGFMDYTTVALCHFVTKCLLPIVLHHFIALIKKKTFHIKLHYKTPLITVLFCNYKSHSFYQTEFDHAIR